MRGGAALAGNLAPSRVTVVTSSEEPRLVGSPSSGRTSPCPGASLPTLSSPQAGELVHVLGDAHVYSNHVEPLLLQLEREPRAFPVLTIDPTVRDIDAFRFEHLSVEGYDPWPTIKMDMAV